MGLSKTEVNLRRLLAAAPRQQNQAKLIHYIATLREQLELLGTETTAEGLTSISKAKLNDYSEKIEALAATLSTPQIQGQPIGSVDATDDSLSEDTASSKEQVDLREDPSHGLRRRHVPHTEGEDRTREITEPDQAAPIKLDATAQVHIEKHRKLQEDLTDEMVELARQLKESSLVMSQSVQNTEKILDSTEKAVEHSLASTGRANTKAAEIYSETVKTSCFTWLLSFTMICVFVMVVLLIRVT